MNVNPLLLLTRCHRCLVAGFFANVAKLSPDGRYRTVRDSTVVAIHSSSVLAHFGSPPEWILFNEISKTSQLFARDVSVIDPRYVQSVPSCSSCTSAYNSLLLPGGNNTAVCVRNSPGRRIILTIVSPCGIDYPGVVKAVCFEVCMGHTLGRFRSNAPSVYFVSVCQGRFTSHAFFI